MKYLINDSYKAIRTGEFVEANEENSEFIFDTTVSVDDTDFTLSNLKDIAKENKIEFTSRANKSDLFEIVAEGLSNLKLKQVNKMTESAIAEKIIKEGFEEGKTEDDMVVELIESGIGFKAAGRIFQQISQSLGLMLSSKERTEKASELLEKIAPKEFSDYEAVGELIAKVMQEVPSTDPKQAMSQIRKYCKLNEIDIPKPSKRTGGVRAKVFEYMVTNPTATLEEFTEFMIELDRTEATIRRSWELFEVARQMAENLIGEQKPQKKAA